MISALIILAWARATRTVFFLCCRAGDVVGWPALAGMVRQALVGYVHSRLVPRSIVATIWNAVLAGALMWGSRKSPSKKS
eukprot:1050373-Pyramimonas_sp.AAC.1